jgi:hypothetical protein
MKCTKKRGFRGFKGLFYLTQEKDMTNKYLNIRIYSSRVTETNPSNPSNHLIYTKNAKHNLKREKAWIY